MVLIALKDIWNAIDPYLKEFEIDYVEHPHEVTLHAKKLMILLNGFIKTMVITVMMQF